jgi:uncharacterized protein (TIGR03437 family)
MTEPAGRGPLGGDADDDRGGAKLAVLLRDARHALMVVCQPRSRQRAGAGQFATRTVTVIVTAANGSASGTATLAAYAPSFLLLDGKHVAGIIPRSNGSGVYGGGTYDILGPTGSSLGYAIVAAKAGDTVELFAVGLGPTDPAVPAGQVFTGAAPVVNPVTVLINNASLSTSFVGLSGAGLYQINLTIPLGLGAGDMPLQAVAGGSPASSSPCSRDHQASGAVHRM